MTARDQKVIAIVLVVAALAASWMLVIQPKRSQASKLGGQVNAEQAQLSTTQSQLSAGEAARSAYGSSYTALTRLGEAVPADDNVPSLIYQVQAAASASRVDFRTLTLSPSGSSAPPPSSPTAGQAVTAALPPGASVGPAGLPTEPFTFTFNGNFFHLADFLGRLERFVVASNSHVAVSGRLMTLNAISLGAGPAGFPQISATVSATTYLAPASQGATNGASPSGPAGTGAPQSVSTSSSPSSPAPAAASTPIR